VQGVTDFTLADKQAGALRTANWHGTTQRQQVFLIAGCVGVRKSTVVRRHMPPAVTYADARDDAAEWFTLIAGIGRVRVGS
jgi:hypothetical protein